jgi:hypothetical protein
MALCSLAEVEIERSAEPLAFADTGDWDSLLGRFSEQFVPEALMVSFEVVVLDILADDSPKVVLAKRHDPPEALGFDRTHEALGEGVEIGTSDWKPHGADVSSFEDCAKRLGEEWIAIHDEVARVAQEAIDIVSKIASNLLHPSVVRVVGDASDVHAPGFQVNHEQDEIANESKRREHFNRKEIGRRDGVPVRLEKRWPRCAFASVRRGVNAMLGENSSDRVSADFVPDVSESAANARVIPRRVLAWPSGRLSSRL